MHYAILARDQVTVENVILADQEFVNKNYPTAILVEDFNPRPGLGWKWDAAAKTFTDHSPVSNPLIENKDNIHEDPRFRSRSPIVSRS